MDKVRPQSASQVEDLARILALANGFNYGGLSFGMKQQMRNQAAAVLDAGYQKVEADS
jgi:hypothetical protein